MRFRKIENLAVASILLIFARSPHSMAGAEYLWDNLYEKCASTGITFSCVQNKLVEYVNGTFDDDQLRITDGIYFLKNSNDLSGMGDHLSNSWTREDEILFKRATPTAAQDEKAFVSFINAVEEAEKTEEDRDEAAGNDRRTADNNHKAADHYPKTADNDQKVAVNDKSTADNHPKVADNAPIDAENDPKAADNNQKVVDNDPKKAEINEKVVENNPKEADITQRPADNYKQEADIDHEAADDEARAADNDPSLAASLNKVADVLYDKTAHYFSTHDLSVALPRFAFGDSRINVSPRGFDRDGGILLKVDFLPQVADNPAQPRLFGHMKKVFTRMFKKKLLTSFLALLLIIKLIKIKLFYILPLIVGIKTAKKLLLKVLLFLFPPLVHLFKMCSAYHAHAQKYHYHHHKVKHHHHHIKVPVPVPVPVPYKPHSYEGHEEYGFEHGPPDHSQSHGYGPPPADFHGENALGPSGTGSDSTGAFSLDHYVRNDMNKHAEEMDSWGLRDFWLASTESPGVLNAQAQAFSPYAESNYVDPNKQPVVPSKYSDYSALNKNSLQSYPNSKSKLGSKGGSTSVLVSYDPFFSPILVKIDALLSQLGFSEEGCKERLICSMYKSPNRFSPHSNLLSSELSRDPEELERASYTNTAAIRFYRYVEAARDGQSGKDCLKLYSACTVKTE